MNVDEYFPEGLSAIHHEESQRESRSTNERSFEFPAVLHCHICYKSINSVINNFDYVKPCNCQLMFVHTACAIRNKEKFGEAKCSNCGCGSTIPRSAKLRNVGRVGSGSSCCSDDGIPCLYCKDKNHKNKNSNSSKQSYKIKPCFCRKVFHYGCLRPLIDEKPLCSECSVVYSNFEPATTSQFFATKWKWYLLYSTFLSVCTTLFLIALKNSLLFTKNSSSEHDINKEISLTLLSVFFVVVIVATVFSVIKYTWSTALPKFHVTRGKVILKPFKNGNNVQSARNGRLEKMTEKEFDDIPLNDLKYHSTENIEEAVEDVRGMDNDDITLGQHMFGVYETHHSSSTPIEKPSLGFVFNSA